MPPYPEGSPRGSSSRSHSYDRRDETNGRAHPQQRVQGHDSDIRRPNQSRMGSYDPSDPRARTRSYNSSYGRDGDDYERRRATNSQDIPPSSRPPMGKNDRDNGDYDPRQVDRRRPPVDSRYNDPPPRDYHSSKPAGVRYNDPLSRSIRPQPDRYHTDKGPSSRRRSPDRDYAREERRRPSPRRNRYNDDSDRFQPPRRPQSADNRDQDRSYGDDRPYRSQRSSRDDHDRGYRSDHGGMDSPRRDTRRGDPPPRERDKERRSNRDRHDRDRRPATGSEKNKGGLSNMMVSGQKYWKQAEPVAKPILTELARAYLQGR